MIHSKTCSARQDGILAHCDCVVCHCSICHKPIHQPAFDTRQVADLRIYHPDGDLDGILLAHKDCGIQANAQGQRPPWVYT